MMQGRIVTKDLIKLVYTITYIVIKGEKVIIPGGQLGVRMDWLWVLVCHSHDTLSGG